jgi:hypothetical protein
MPNSKFQKGKGIVRASSAKDTLHHTRHEPLVFQKLSASNFQPLLSIVFLFRQVK